MPDLLIELFSEEIPARMQTRAAADLKRLMTDALIEAGLTYAGAEGFATPRRLTLAVQGLSPRSPETRERRRGPRVDAPEKAVQGFLRATGLSLSDLAVEEEKKGRVYVAEIVTPGRDAPDIVAEALEGVIRRFPWPKSMRWGAGSLRWVRPLRAILCILSDEAGAEVVPLEIDGFRAGNVTRGHRFLSPEPFSVNSFEDYEAKLRRAHVILRAKERADHIWHEVTTLAFAAGLEPVEDKGLLAEVAGLVEWPVPLLGEIGADFLDLPAEVLRTSMKEHQKFFSLRAAKGGQITHFVTVANIKAPDGGAAILAGNRKVLSARLSDAKFFWDNDLRVAREAAMQPWLDRLETVTFLNKLGSQGDRVRRIAALARAIAPRVGADPELAEEAARVAKADLASEMVYEFPELQGRMGRLYAEAAGMRDEVAAAAEEHYAPLGPDDDVPEASVSVAVALADKLDMLTGFWAIDEKPTGSRDPFALRRAALGVIRLVVANGLRINLDTWIDTGLLRHKIALHRAAAQEGEIDTLEEVLDEIAARGVFGAALRAVLDARRRDGRDVPEKAPVLRTVGDAVPDLSTDLLAFLHDRLKVHLRAKGLRHDVIDAVLAMPGSDDLTLVVARAKALNDTLATEDGENLVQGFKRANNILTQAEEADGVEYSFGPDPKYAEDETEKALFAALDAADAEIRPAMQAEDFARAMAAMAALRAPIDAFFEAVQVNAPNPVLRRNRLNLLARIRATCLQVADLRHIEG